MKTILFPVIGLVLGTLGGTAFSGLKEKDVLLAEAKAAAEQAAQEAEHQEPADGESGAGASGEAPGPEAQVEQAGHLSEETAETTDPKGAEEAPTTHAEESGEGPGEGSDQGEGHDPGEAPEEPVQDPGPVVVEEQQKPTEDAPEAGGGTARLAKIFGAMKAPDAAKVLQNLDDEEISAVLFHLSNRKAAEILGNFEPARAATLSRIVLGSSGGEES